MRKSLLLLAFFLIAGFASTAVQADDAGATIPATAVGGLIFTDVTSIHTIQEEAGKPSVHKDPDGFGLDVKRGYLTVNHSFDALWSTVLTADFNFASYKATSTVTGGPPGETVSTTVTTPETQLFVKKLYLQGHFDPWATLRIGSADMPWTSYVEGIYGYRFVENTLTDRNGFANTADWGLHLSGGGGLASYAVSLVNGGGYKNPSRSKGMDEEGRMALTPLSGRLVVAVGFYTGRRGQDTEAAPAANTANREDLLLAWKASGLTLGLEWFGADKWNDVRTPGNKPTTKSSGASLFGSFDFPATAWSVFARYDDVKPTQDTDSAQEDRYYDAGVAWRYSPSLTWALAYKDDKLTDDLKLGNSTDSLKTREFGIWAQAKF